MLDPRSFRQMMGCFATGIGVVTLRLADGSSAGMTINSLTSVSLDPPLVLFCIDRQAHLYPAFKKAKHFAFNFLGKDQEAVSRHFADAHHNPRPPGLWDKPQQDCPVLRGTLGWMVAQKVETHKGGDHDIFVCRVTGLHKRSGHRDPLLYFHGRYRRIKS